jgi:hypothetical protein
MPAEKGNQYYLLRSKHGRNKKYENVEDFSAACVEYFETVLENPIITKQLVSYKGDSWLEDLPHTPPFTLTGLQLWIGITDQTWHNYKQDKDFLEVIQWVEKTIYNQKFEGAAVGVYNANIISRDLGLIDKKEVKANVFSSDTPLEFE